MGQQTSAVRFDRLSYVPNRRYENHLIPLSLRLLLPSKAPSAPQNIGSSVSSLLGSYSFSAECTGPLGQQYEYVPYELMDVAHFFVQQNRGVSDGMNAFCLDV